MSGTATATDRDGVKWTEAWEIQDSMALRVVSGGPVWSSESEG